MTTLSKVGATRGAWMMLGEPGLTGRIASAGFDWILLDQQHGAIGPDRLVELARAHDHSASMLAVRVASDDAHAIGRALDVGATIVVVPMVESAAQAGAIVSAAQYPPRGRRSWGPLTAMWGRSPLLPTESDPRVWVMVETREALDALSEICAVPELDSVFVGPYDLSLALGTTVQELLDDTDGQLARIVSECRDAGISSGAFAGSAAVAERLREIGFDNLAVATDVGIVDAGAAHALPGGDPARSLY